MVLESIFFQSCPSCSEELPGWDYQLLVLHWSEGDKKASLMQVAWCSVTYRRASNIQKFFCRGLSRKEFMYADLNE